MKRITKILLTFIIGIFLSVPFVKVNAANEPVKIYMFYGNGCPYCESALEYFSSIEAEYGDKFDVVKYEVWYDATNSALLQAVAKTMGDEVSGVPYFVIGDKSFSGYNEQYNSQIIDAIEKNYNSETRYDVLAETDFDASTANGESHENSGTSGNSNNYSATSSTSTIASYIILGVLVLGLVGLLIFAKEKAKEEN